MPEPKPIDEEIALLTSLRGRRAHVLGAVAGLSDAVLTESATHAGHPDAVRELIDGRTWLVLT